MLGSLFGRFEEPKERKVKEEIVKHLIFVRRDSKIDIKKLEELGFHVVEGDSVLENTDFGVIKHTNIVTTTYMKEEEESENEEI